MAEYLIQDTTLDAIADAINAKTGGSSAMTPAEMVTAIGTISGGGGDIIPPEYQEVEYIESSGGAFINTGLASNFQRRAANVTFVISFKIIMLNGSTQILLGCGSEAGNWFGVLSDGTVSLGGGINFQDALYSDVNNVEVVFKSSGLSATIGSETLSRNAIGAIAANTAFLFADSSAKQFPCAARIYSAEAWQFGVKLRNFVPCYRIADDLIGLYDTITGQFYTNASSTGSFTKGSDVFSEQQALTRYANELTGANDPDLISAAETLITERIKEDM